MDRCLPNGEWKGSPAELLGALFETVPSGDQYKDKGFPSGPIALSKQLKNIEKLMEAQDIELKFGRSKDRWISITNLDLY